MITRSSQTESSKPVSNITQLHSLYLREEDLPLDGTSPETNGTTPLNFFLSSSRNEGVVPLVTGDAARPPEPERAPLQLQILQAPPLVEEPDDNDDDYIAMAD